MFTVPATSGLPLWCLQSYAEDLAFISLDHNGTSVGMLKITCYTECYHGHGTIKEHDVTDFHTSIYPWEPMMTCWARYRSLSCHRQRYYSRWAASQASCGTCPSRIPW